MLAHLRKVIETRGSENGATAAEYALLIVAIALIMVVGAFFLGNALNNKFKSTGSCISSGPASSGC